MTELWSVARVADYFGVTPSRARHILADHGIQQVRGYPAGAVRDIPRYGQGARTDLNPQPPEAGKAR